MSKTTPPNAFTCWFRISNAPMVASVDRALESVGAQSAINWHENNGSVRRLIADHCLDTRPTKCHLPPVVMTRRLPKLSSAFCRLDRLNFQASVLNDTRRKVDCRKLIVESTSSMGRVAARGVAQCTPCAIFARTHDVGKQL